MEPAGTTTTVTTAAAYPRKILDYMEGFLVSKTLFTACELGVFDLLASSQHPLSLEEVALGIRASQDGTERLLAACTGLDLLNTHTLEGQVTYSNTEQSSVYLTQSSPVSLTQSIHYSSKTIYLCWHYLTDAVRSEEEMVKFMQLMNSIWNICGRDVVTAFNLSPFTTIYDLGGEELCCSGALAKQCVLAYPECTVTIFDLPKVVKTSREHFVTDDNQRVSFHEGDFFKDALPDADLYILARILHDWTDARSIELLTKVYRACRPGGGVLVVEALLCEDGSGPLTAQLYSLNMLVQTEGKERTAAEYTALLTAAGFQNVQVERTGKIYDAVLGRK
uniref:acetylserotonin O-methyltransferase isoform X3 n=1 Tax=Oncorhynchus gorbuscha TaxID=8017 RepID=UPI001EAECAA0|nr:acetylserotonin O-methyltransferase isoform X3 [Oncorhynchus gorbuscha]